MGGWVRILMVGVIIALFLITFFGLVLGNGLSRNPGAQRDDQCELLATKSNPNAAVLEPQNTWSNLAYLIAGTLILYRSRTLLGAAVGLNLAFEFLFSSLYHSKLILSMQVIDVGWIYVLLLALLAYAVQSLVSLSTYAIQDIPLGSWSAKTGNWTLTNPVGIALGISVAAIILGVVMGLFKAGDPNHGPFDSTLTTVILVVLVAIPLLIGLVWAGALRASASYVALSIVLIISVGVPTMFFRFSDGDNHLFGVSLCCPKAVLQAHAAWHILSAFMVLIAYDICADCGGDSRIFSFGESLTTVGV